MFNNQHYTTKGVCEKNSAAPANPAVGSDKKNACR